jgi:dolichol-phosphate mannosyltransferase
LRLGNNFVTWATNLFHGTRLHDVETCYKMLSREVVDRLALQSEGFDLESELTAQIVRLGYPIHEVPISYHPRYGAGEKLSPLDGIPATMALIKERFR